MIAAPDSKLPAKMSATVSLAIALLLLAVAVLRIIAVHSVFVQTYDEGAHIAAGMEWLDRGTFRTQPHHPPLRTVYAVGPYLLGIRFFGAPNYNEEGNRILYANDEYERNLSAARMGALPFFLLTGLVVWLWAARTYSVGVALLAVILVSTLPIILGHSAIATTDILITATYLLALFTFTLWLEQPTYHRSSLLGATLALALLSKFSAVLFLTASCGAIAVLSFLSSSAQGAPRIQRLRAILNPKRVALVVLAGFVVVWAGYRFSLEGLTTAAGRPHDAVDGLLKGVPALHDIAYALVEMPLPAHELVRGFTDVFLHVRMGHLSYLLGEIRTSGWLLFFPVGILVKSPIPFLILTLIGFVYTARRGFAARDWRPMAPAVAACILLAVSIPISINIGVRQILPIFPLLVILAAAGCAALWRWRTPARLGPVLAIAFVAWHLASSARAHPDYLAYFNECCEAQPERVLVDSDLDWGQDLKRLAAELRRRGIEEINLAYFGKANPSRHGMPRIKPMRPGEPVSGWIAISEHQIAFGTRTPPYNQFQWLKAHTPVARVGKSIRLYHID